MAVEHISLYRKWRPQGFGEVVGQRHVTETLSNAIASGRLVHAYLFCGPRGTGKTSTARILAKAINCEQGPTPTPCNSCDACRSISDGTALDVIELDAASNRKIDEIRDLLDKIPYAPTALRSKVYIIDEVHQLTPEASSALLKTLEEPPAHVRFVLATTEPHKILPTIISRCQRFDFSLVPTPEVSRLLESIASSEGIDIEPEAVAMIAEHAHGSLRDAIGVMDQIANLAGERITQERLAEMLGEVEADLVFETVDLIVERDTPGALHLVERMVSDGKDPRRFTESLISHLRSLFLVQNAAKAREIVEVTDEHYERLEEQANRLRRHEVVRLIEKLGETHREMRWSETPRLILECTLVRATRVDVDVSLEGLLYRLEELETKVQGIASGEGQVTATAGPATGASKDAPTAKKAPARKKEQKPPAPPEKKAKAPAERAGPAPDLGGESATGDGSSSGREKARRAWMAVLAELKKQGRMRVYALLTKARVKEAGGGRLVLGFPEEATFQLDLLSESGDLDSLEEACSRLMGEPVKLKLEPMGARAPAGGSAPRPATKKAARPAAKKPAEEQAAADEAAPGTDDVAPKKGSTKDLAKLLEKEFDGEIIEENK